MKPWFMLFSFLAFASVSFAQDTLPSDGLSITPQDGHTIFIDSIDQAQTSIDMIMYHITDPLVVDHIISAQKRDVKVRIIEDQQSFSKASAKALADQMTAAGVEVHPGSTGFSITHAKSAVFDKTWALVTSINMTKTDSFTRDYGIRTYDADVVNEFESVFETDLQNSQTGGNSTPALSVGKLAWSPVNSKDKILAFLNSAKQSIFIEVENLGDRDILSALEAQAKQGVKVTVIVPACVEGGGTRNLSYVSTLASAGVDARLSMPPYTRTNPYIHAKAIVVDQQSFYVGSENLSYNSLTQARELGILESNANISSVILMAFNYDYKLASVPSQVSSSLNCDSFDSFPNNSPQTSPGQAAH
ncbi:MAG: phospholipase D-like domain-containing protein [Bacillota bacterium]